MKRHKPGTISALKAIDSPTISNAIERFEVRSHVSGYAGFDIRCAFPGLDPMVGYAVTCFGDSTSEGRQNKRGLFELWEALDISPKPAVIVIKDVGPDRARSCHLGEVMATTAKALGAVGCVCDGGLRDINEIEALGEFQLFSPGFVVSHGNPVIYEVGKTVRISGMDIRPGDLLHGDLNGLLTVPAEIADRVAEEADRVREQESEILQYAKSEGFSLEGLRKLQDRIRH